MNFDLINKISRNYYGDNRHPDGIRCDRNEKVEDWDKSLFNEIFNKINKTELTSYPKTQFDELYNNLSNYLDVEKNSIYISNGSDCIIRDFFIMYNKKLKNIAILEDTYGMYNVYPKLFDMKIHTIPYLIDENSNDNICKLNKKILYEKLDLIDCFCFVNPNQISNDDIQFKELEDLCKKYPNKIFFIDEAYYGFGNYSAVSLTKKYKNIFVARSFSKTFGLASLRIGILIGHKDSIKPFINLSTIYCTNLFGDKIGNYFLENIEIVENYNKKVIEGRNWIVNKLREKQYKIIDPNSMSIFIYCINEEMQNFIYNTGLKYKIYLKKWKSKNIFFIRLTCGPMDIMELVFKKIFSKYNIYMKFQKEIEMYKQKGYFILPNYFTDEKINLIDKKIQNLKNDIDLTKSIYTLSKSNNKLMRIEYFIKENKEIYESIINEELHNLICNLLDDEDFYLYKDKFISKQKNSDEFLPHTDGIYKTYNYRKKKETMGWYTYATEFIQFGIMMTDNNEENGCLNINDKITDDINHLYENYVDKESKSGYINPKVLKEKKILDNSTKIIGKKGSIFFFNPKCIHFSSINKTNETRDNLYLTFNKKSEGDNYQLARDDKNLLLKEIGQEALDKRSTLKVV